MKQAIKTVIDNFMHSLPHKGYAATEELRDIIINMNDVNDRFDAAEYAKNYYGVII